MTDLFGRTAPNLRAKDRDRTPAVANGVAGSPTARSPALLATAELQRCVVGSVATYLGAMAAATGEAEAAATWPTRGRALDAEFGDLRGLARLQP